MRKNLPVTQRDFPIRDGAVILSKTDVKGRITGFNEDFLEAAGFEPDELHNQPHNIVRHPDMPEIAFQDFWGYDEGRSALVCSGQEPPQER